MKAIVHEKYGSPDVLELQEIEKPSPQADEVLVRVHASSVNPADWYSLSGLLISRMRSGFFRPKNIRMGTDYAGVVETVGENVQDFRPGDEVYGGRSGAYAEYVCVKNAIAHKPANVTFEQAAAAPTAGITALQGLRDHGKIQPGQKVLINGAAGGVGTFAVQIAKAFGAEVTGVCSTRNVELVRSLGADHVFDYTREDFTRNGQRYDLILDNAGSRSWAEYKRVLTPNATFVIVGAPKSKGPLGPLGQILKLRFASRRASQQVTFFIAQFNRDDLGVLRDLIEAGKVTPYVERTYPLKETTQAMHYQGTGHARGKVVISMNS